MRLGHSAELPFPIAIEDDPVDVTAASVCLPSVGFGGVEIDVDCRTCGVVRIKHRDDRALANEGPCDPGGDAFTSHVGKHLVFELRRICAAFTHQVTVE